VYVAVVAALVHITWAVKKDLTWPILYIGIVAVLFAARWRRRAVAETVRPA
jgi:DMSO/TMAO reductase YedYZ heme-binding membrane subunit